MSTPEIPDGIYEIFTNTHHDLIVTMFTDNGGEGTRIRVSQNDGYEVNLIGFFIVFSCD
jgi:hypothetical protein